MLFAMIVSPFHPCMLSPLISACTGIDHLKFFLFTAFKLLSNSANATDVPKPGDPHHAV